MVVRYKDIDYVCGKATLGIGYVELEDVTIGDGTTHTVLFEGIMDRTEFEVIDGEWSYPNMPIEQQVEKNTEGILKINNLMDILAGE